MCLCLCVYVWVLTRVYVYVCGCGEKLSFQFEYNPSTRTCKYRTLVCEYFIMLCVILYKQTNVCVSVSVGNMRGKLYRQCTRARTKGEYRVWKKQACCAPKREANRPQLHMVNVHPGNALELGMKNV